MGGGRRLKPQLGEKDLLTSEETIKYFNLSRRKWYDFLNSDRSKKFVVGYRSRRLILREEFEEFLNKNKKVKEELAYVGKEWPKKRLEA